LKKNDKEGIIGPVKEHPDGTIKTFVRRTGRMSDQHRNRFDELASAYLLTPEPGQILDPAAHLPGFSRCILEIGFGMGHALVQLAGENPDTGYLGIDVHKPGVARAMAECRDKNLTNVKVMEEDALDLCRGPLKQESFDGIHIFFPDPWQKKRHHKRRLIQDAHMAPLLRVLKPGGYLYCVTDWEEYADDMLAVTNRCPQLTNPSGGFCPPVPWRPKTRFEEKGLKKDHVIRELYLVKR
jgi:tRNA (guanine-N7-)-methyltransferase